MKVPLPGGVREVSWAQQANFVVAEWLPGKIHCAVVWVSTGTGRCWQNLGRPVSDRIAYVVDTFPLNAGSGAVRQILALERQGFVMVPLALHRDRTRAVPEASRRLAEHVIYLPPVLSLRCAASQLQWLLAGPAPDLGPRL